METVQETIGRSASEAAAPPPVRKSVRVRASAARAFKVFTEGIDTWWPKTHHIGNSPMTKAMIEGWVGGRAYSEQENGIDCQWGQVLAWEPPARFVLAWQATHEWRFEPDVTQCSEVEVRFTPATDGTTLVELEHRNFERQGAGGASMRNQVDQPGGWGGLMELFRAEAEKEG
jgi:uncharacterized protein YndB with AHSA1/START domain